MYLSIAASLSHEGPVYSRIELLYKNWGLVANKQKCIFLGGVTIFQWPDRGHPPKVRSLNIRLIKLPILYLRHAASSKVITPCSSLLMKTVLCLLPLQTLTYSRFLLYSNPSDHQLPAWSLL